MNVQPGSKTLKRRMHKPEYKSQPHIPNTCIVPYIYIKHWYSSPCYDMPITSYINKNISLTLRFPSFISNVILYCAYSFCSNATSYILFLPLQQGSAHKIRIFRLLKESLFSPESKEDRTPNYLCCRLRTSHRWPVPNLEYLVTFLFFYMGLDLKYENDFFSILT